MRRTSICKGLIMSLLSVLVCISLLVSVSLAWFTGDASNTTNKIETGTMGMNLLKFNESISAYREIGTDKLFDQTLWEPGMTKIVFLAVKNTGSLTLGFDIKLDVTQGDIRMNQVMEYAVMCSMPKSAFEAKKLGTWESISGYSGAKTDRLSVGNYSTTSTQTLPVGGTSYFVIAIHMIEDVDNKYQGGWINIDLEIAARQMSGEEDYFGKSYDSSFAVSVCHHNIVTATFDKFIVFFGFKSFVNNCGYFRSCGN